MDALSQTAVDAIDREKTALNDISQTIWHFKELSFQEKQSHSALCDFLAKRGFQVERECAGLETAFVARWETKDDDVASKTHIAVLCEYDALPDIGHACGHNLIAEIGLAAGLGIKSALEKNNITGKLSVIGTPAEEGGGGKLHMLKAGVFDDVDVALMAHPAPFSDARPIFLSTRRCSATFEGKESHAAGFPWEGVNALDATVQAYVSLGMLRQQMKPEWRASAIITNGGKRANIIPNLAAMEFQVRTPKESEILELEQKVKKCVRAAAEATGCAVTMEDGATPYKCLVSNETLARLYESSLKALGVEVTTPKTKKVLGSTDMGDVSHQVPSLHPNYDCNTTAFNHTVEFTRAAGSPEAQAPTLIQGKALAMTGLQVLRDAGLLTQVKADFQKDKEDF